MKTLLKVLAGIGLVVAVGVSAIFYFTSGLVDTADEFFAAVAAADSELAYSYMSADFRASASRAELEAYLQANALDNITKANWSSRSLTGGKGSLEGSAETADGGVTPITLNFVKGDEGWRIYSLQKPAAGLSEETTSQAPSSEKVLALTSETTQVWAQAIDEQDMSKLYAHVSQLWQRQTSAEELGDIFSGFYDTGADFSVFNSVSPIFDEAPSIDEDGVMKVSGYYPTNPAQLHFEHSYVYEGLDWKLAGVRANIE